MCTSQQQPWVAHTDPGIRSLIDAQSLLNTLFRDSNLNTCPHRMIRRSSQARAHLLVQREGLLKQQGGMVLHNLGYIDTCILCCKPHRHQTSCQLTHVSSEQSTGDSRCEGQSVANVSVASCQFAPGSAFCLLDFLECMAARQCCFF